MTGALDRFAAEVGNTGPVTCVGGNTQSLVGGAVDSDARAVRAPAGIVSYQPSEMTITALAGTPVTELVATLAEHGQTVAMPIVQHSTIGGVLAVGRSSLVQLGHGPVRETLLQARFVNAGGELVKVGGPTVKNVTGFDLCRLLVGSLGTLGFMVEVILRTRPVAACTQWFRADDADPFALRRSVYRPASILWDGTTTWICIDGHPDDVAALASSIGPAFAPCDGPESSSGQTDRHRWTMSPSDLRAFANQREPGTFMALVGIGEAWCQTPQPVPDIDPRLRQLEYAVKATMDPTGRMNPGRTPGKRET